jgi:hypothetical protein
VRSKTSVQSSKKQRKLQKNPGTTLGVSSNIRRPKINEKVYRDYETTGEKKFSPTVGKNGRSRAGKRVLLRKINFVLFYTFFSIIDLPV